MHTNQMKMTARNENKPNIYSACTRIAKQPVEAIGNLQIVAASTATNCLTISMPSNSSTTAQPGR